MSKCEQCGEWVDWNNPNIHYGGHVCKPKNVPQEAAVNYTKVTPLTPVDIEILKQTVEIYKKQTRDFLDLLHDIVNSTDFDEVRRMAYEMINKFE